jgi:hypothetical protein
MEVQVRTPSNGSGLGNAHTTDGGPVAWSLFDTFLVDPSRLAIKAVCYTDVDTGAKAPVPSFDLSLTFQWTQRSLTPTTPFQ